MPSLYIVLERKIPNSDPFVNGNALSKNYEELDRLAKLLKAIPLTEFFSVSKEELAGLVGDEEAERIAVPEEKWFSAEEGLQTVNAWLASLEKSKLSGNTRVESELREFAKVLELAKSSGVRWHLAVDY